ncbi:MAG: NAD-dependent epimerase/dehydratase family protein [bacterium]|nr:NAD-dependent epimerase/dehydratase family protein [bacterium]MCP5071363.1 NAD-dependent epimerase/dehydratase family protein [bacterium]
MLVTGGAGFVGSHLVDALVEAGHRVRVLDNLDPQVHGEGGQRPTHLHEDAELQVGDVRDRAAVARALEDIDQVFHQAAAVGVGQSMYQMEQYVSVNSVGAAVLLEEIVARRDRVQKMVVASSMSIYGEGAYRTPEGATVFPGLRPDSALEAQRFEMHDDDGRELQPIPTPEQKPLVPTSIYAITKRDHEEMFLAVGAAYGIPAVALRYFNIYGPRQSLSNPYTGVMAIFSSRIMNRNRPMIFEDGLQSRDFVHVSDIVQANLLAMGKDEADGKVFNVGTGRSTSILRVAEILAEQLDFPDPPDVVGKFRAGDIRHCFADTSRIEKQLGYAPAMTMESGMRNLLEWIRTQKADDRVEQAARELEARGLTR